MRDEEAGARDRRSRRKVWAQSACMYKEEGTDPRVRTGVSASSRWPAGSNRIGISASSRLPASVDTGATGREEIKIPALRVWDAVARAR